VITDGEGRRQCGELVGQTADGAESRRTRQQMKLRAGGPGSRSKAIAHMHICRDYICRRLISPETVETERLSTVDGMRNSMRSGSGLP